jgi:hypothetical protein
MYKGIATSCHTVSDTTFFILLLRLTSSSLSNGLTFTTYHSGRCSRFLRPYSTSPLYPDTRVKLIARITAWFEGENLQDLLLWITGPAGVGKSAIVQTIAEYLSKSKSLGASVFIFRPNKRNNPHGIFITIAYQLATRIEVYRNFIVERISFDPELLRGDMQAQFTAFIVEPFVEKRVGEGGKR